jgi:hypothetical protein
MAFCYRATVSRVRIGSAVQRNERALSVLSARRGKYAEPISKPRPAKRRERVQKTALQLSHEESDWIAFQACVLFAVSTLCVVLQQLRYALSRVSLCCCDTYLRDSCARDSTFTSELFYHRRH